MAVSEDSKPTIILTQFSSVLFYVHREGRGAQNVHLDFHTAPELSLTQLLKLSLTRIKMGELSLTRIKLGELSLTRIKMGELSLTRIKLRELSLILI